MIVAEIHCQVIVKWSDKDYDVDLLLSKRKGRNWPTNTWLKWCRYRFLCASGQIPLTCPDSQDSRFDDLWLCHSLVLVCVVTLLTHSIQNPMSWNNQMNIFRHKPFELPVSPTQSVQSTSMLIWFSEFIGHLDDNFPQSLIIKYSDKTDSPLESVNGKLDNRIRGTQHLKLAQSGW